MSAPAPGQFEAEVERRVAERTADLSELLGHLSSSWDDQRRLLARQLHDSLGSSMTALTMHLALLTGQLPPDKNLQTRTAQMKALLTGIINTNRDMQIALWNDKLEFLGVKAALAELASEFGARHHITVRVSLPDEEAPHAREQAVALLRTCEEGLRNVIAHAHASEIDVILDDNDEEITLTVRDNGVGPGDQTKPAGACHGLRLLRERARYLGGQLRVSALPAGGTALAITLPRQAPRA
jgi:signal transduction histidine kinase